MDTIFYHGVVHTMAGRTVSAIAVQGSRIALAGSDEAALALRTPDTRCIDLRGRCILPGFADSHMHLLHTALTAHRLDLSQVRSLEELIEKGRAYLVQNPPQPGEWIVCYGFDQNRFDVPVLPDGAAAEAISREHPVILDRVCGHVGAGNKKALALAGFDENTHIPGGQLDKDAQGRLTGVVREAALDWLRHTIPRLNQHQVEQLVLEAGGSMARAGLTSLHSDDLGSEGTDWPVLKAAFQALSQRQECPVRLFEEWMAPRPEQLAAVFETGLRSGDGDDWLRLCNVKLLADGSLGAQTAYLRQPYHDAPDKRGIPVYTQEELEEMVALCHSHDLQVACHCIGDGACQQFVTAVEKAMAADPKPLCHRVVHCQFGDLALYQHMAALGMGADVQPAFVPTDSAIARERVGDRVRESYAWKTLMECGVLVGGGSDSPVEDFSPLWGIHCAVNRPGLGGVFGPEQRLSVEQAVRMYTVTPARLAGRQQDLGTLEAGKLADLVVLDRDIFTVPPEEIRNLQVEATMVGGGFSYCREEEKG